MTGLNINELYDTVAKLFSGKHVRWVVAYGDRFPGWWIVRLDGEMGSRVIGPDGKEGSPE